MGKAEVCDIIFFNQLQSTLIKVSMLSVHARDYFRV